MATMRMMERVATMRTAIREIADPLGSLFSRTEKIEFPSRKKMSPLLLSFHVR